MGEVADHLKMTSSGGIKRYLENLENALFITSYTPYNLGLDSKLKKYKLTDDFLRFFFKYIRPNLKLIKSNTNKNIFNTVVKDRWSPWLGLAFENFCLKNANILADKMNFSDQVINFGPFYKKGDKNFQIDLLFLRADKTITLCEMKYHDRPINTKIISEVNRKCELLSVPRGFSIERALVSLHGADRPLRDSEYFHHEISLKDFFN